MKDIVKINAYAISTCADLIFALFVYSAAFCVETIIEPLIISIIPLGTDMIRVKLAEHAQFHQYMGCRRCMVQRPKREPLFDSILEAADSWPLHDGDQTRSLF
jgi:hypothetical protein